MGCSESKPQTAPAGPPKASGTAHASAQPQQQAGQKHQGDAPSAAPPASQHRRPSVAAGAPPPPVAEESNQKGGYAPRPPQAAQGSSPEAASAVQARPTAGAGGAVDLQQLHITCHNDLRRQHRAPDLVFDAGLARNAQIQAEKCLKQSRMEHGTCDNEGQNIYMMGFSGCDPSSEEAVRDAVKQWYDEISLYKQAGCGLSGMNNGAGHFTQVIWKGSTKVGLGLARSKSEIYVVANYAKGGNIADDYDIRCNVWLAGEPDAPAAPTRDLQAVATSEMPALQQVHIDVHNEYRRKHRAGDLTFDAGLARNAQKQAEICLKKGRMEHGTCDNEGQNIYMMGFSGFSPTSDEVVRDSVKQWYDEISLFKDAGRGLAGMNNGAGHFTQVIWKGSTKVGMGIARSGRELYVVANYSPAGNMAADYEIGCNVWLPGDPDKPAPPKRDLQATSAGEVQSLQKLFVDTHNEYRRKHNAAPLVSDATLSQHAQRQAEVCLKTQTLEHGTCDGEGQNIYMMGFVGCSPPNEESVRDAVNQWYDERPLYTQGGGGLNGLNNGAGHFTQVVWKGTKKVGLGFARSGRELYVVGNYSPAGNLVSAIRENVDA